jgi:2,4-dichlorophenol 6-monooxygenase
MLDLTGHGAFSLWTGIGGEAWFDAAAAITRETGLPITVVSIGPGHELEDPYGTWAELSEIQNDGVLLVRPDLSCRSPAPTPTRRSWSVPL